MTSVCKMNWISSSDEAINLLLDYTYWHFKWVWKVWVQMAILLKFLIMQLCWKESCCIKVSNWTMIHIFYIHLNSYDIYIFYISLAHRIQQPIPKLWILNFQEFLNQWEKDLHVGSCVYLLELGSSDQDSIQAAKPNHNGLTYFRWRFKRQRRGTFKNGVKRAP